MKSLTFQTDTYRCQLYDNGIIYFLSIAKSPNLIPDNDGWGCELGNWRDFFSQLKHNHDTNLVAQSTDWATFAFEAELGTDKWQVTETLSFTTDSITQRFEFVVLSPTARLGDLVNRFVFKQSPLSAATLNRKAIIHSNTNTYYQVPLTEIVFNNNHWQIQIAETNIETPPGYDRALDKTIYLRDEPRDKWIAHARLIAAADGAGDYLARWFYPNELLPTWITRLLASRFWRAFWWRARERAPLSPINLGSVIHVAQGDRFVLTSKVTITI